jgi:hypothetical protein
MLGAALMGLPWVRLDATFPHNYKILQLVANHRHKAVNVYVFGLAYCGHQDTGGHIPAHVLRFIHGTSKDATDLVNAGLWECNGDGWIVHDWDLYNPSAGTSTAMRESSKRAVCTRWMKEGKPCSCGYHT